MKTLADIAVEASKLLNDSQECNDEYNFTRWSKSDLVHYAQDAITMIAMLYPKKFTTSVNVTLTKGVVQKLPTGCTKLTKILGVVDSTGAISSIATSGDDRLGTLFQKMCAESITSSNYQISSYSFEETSDNIFYVQPPVPSGDPIVVSVICSQVPDLDDTGSSYTPEGWMHNMIIEWILYRAYSSEDESNTSDANAKSHLEHFYTILGNYYNAQEKLTESSKASAANASS